MLQDWGHERICVDLAMWMAERHADGFAAVLKDVHVLHVGETAELLGSVAPHLDQVPDVLLRLLAER
jgi:hypothetical protein